MLQIYVHDPTRTDKTLRHLALAAGARLLTRPPANPGFEEEIGGPKLEADPQSIVIVNARRGDEQTSAKPEGCKAVCVLADWLIDSASNYCVQPFGAYLS